MKKYILALVLISLFGCADDELFPSFEFPGKRLAAIRSEDVQTELFSYDANGNNTKVERSYDQGGTVTNISYLNDRPILIEQFEMPSETLYSFDSLFYNSNNALSKIERYSFDDNQTAQINAVIEFTYGSNGYPSQVLYYYPSYANGIQAKNILKWKNGNLVQVDYYGQSGELRYEFFNEYDNHFNYKLGSPYFLSSPENWSKNNITKSTYKDYTGLLDTFCNPCNYAYEYDESGLPIKVTALSGGGFEFFIEYETSETDIQWNLPFQFAK
jgi:hypothetical protein